VELFLTFNEIGVAGADAIAEALGKNSTLAVLYLGCNGIGDAGSQAIAGALHENSKLAMLNLFGNAIGAAGAQAIADALRENSTLAELSLKANPIDHAGLHALFRALRGNWWAITKLDLDNDMPMRNDILEAIAKNCETREAALRASQLPVQLKAKLTMPPFELPAPAVVQIFNHLLPSPVMGIARTTVHSRS
jgi:Ran GTPase-activating protein (RanGAP) involved in mRNA processing and transport